MGQNILSDNYVAYLKSDEEKGKEAPMPKIRDLDLEERPYEKAEKYGIDSLTDSQLLAVILRTGLPGKPITKICKDMIEECGGKFRRLGALPLEGLMSYDGIGKVKAMQILALMEIIRRYNKEEVGDSPLISNSQEAAKLMMPRIGCEAVENIYVLYLSQSLHLIQAARISTGLVNASIFDVKPIIRLALMLNSTCMMLVHNHPSGNMKPSIQDNRITQDLKNACKFFNLRLLDHVIVGGGSNDAPTFYSYFDSGTL